MENILRNLIKMETIDIKKYIFFMLIKFSNQLKPVTDAHDYVPLVYIRNQRILLVYEDEEFGVRSTFTKYENILDVLQILLNEGKEVFFLYENDDALNKDEILSKIDEALDTKDEKRFHDLSMQLKKIEKGE